MSGNELAKFENASRAIGEAVTFYDVLIIKDQAEALRTWGKIAKDRNIEIHGIELRLRAERRLGEMMAEAPKAVGTKGQFTGKTSTGKVTMTVPETKTPNLKSQGIDENLAKRARTLAKMPKAEFNGKIRNLKAQVKDVAHRVVAKDFYNEPKAAPLVNMNDLTRRMLGWLEKTFTDEEDSKIAAYVSELTKHPEEIGDEETKRDLIRKLKQVTKQFEKLIAKLETKHATSNQNRLSHKGM